MRPMLNIAIRAARKGGNILSRAFAQSDKIQVFHKNQYEYTTNVHNDVAEGMISIIHKAYPTHSFMSEELGEIQNDPDHLWIVQPLSGSQNFVKGIPHFALSITLKVKNKTTLCVIYNPILDELFTAMKGSGAQLNDHRIRVSSRHELQGSTLATEYPSAQQQYTQVHTLITHDLVKESSQILCTGASVLNFAYVAAGRLDGYFEMGVKPWSMLAGELIAKEAGAVITDINGSHRYIQSGHLIAATPKVTQHLVKTAHPHLPNAIR